MEFTMKHFSPRLLARVSALLCLGFVAGCSIDSADEFYRDVPVSFAGYYAGNINGKLVDKNSGASITGLDLRQTGDSLEGVDNNGNIWRGTIGDVSQGDSSISASFTLEGQTSSGAEGTFAGNFSTDATSSTDTNGTTTTTSSGKGQMQGTYVEPTLFSTFSGVAQSIPGAIIPDDDSGSSTNDASSTNSTVVVAITPELTTLSGTTNGTVSLTVNMSAGYSYSVETPALGTIITRNGGALTYRQTGSAKGTNRIRVKSGDDSDVATIIQE